MVSDLRKLDEEIARMRGWERGRIGWTRPSSEPDAIRDWWSAFTGGAVPLWDEDDPPPFSSSWALAGVLLEEMRGAVRPNDDGGPSAAWCAHVPGFWRVDYGATPCEAIARAWVAWRLGRA